MKFPYPTLKILTLSFSCIAYIATVRRIVPKTSRSVLFEDTKTGQQLTGSVIRTLPTASRIFCSLKCAQVARCRSFNYCEPNVCLLSSEDFYSVGNSDKLAVRYPNCEYRGMKRDYVPICYERGILKPITDDDDPDNCNFTKKRIDGKYGQWMRNKIHTLTEWKVFDVRETILNSAHGGILRDTLQIHSWFKTGSTNLNWMDSKIFCENMGGELFSAVNGTEEQLDFFYEVFGKARYWLGIYTNDFQSWININGIEVPEEDLVWHRNHPKVRSDYKYVTLAHNLVTSQAEYLKNKNEYLHGSRPLCDMRKN